MPLLVPDVGENLILAMIVNKTAPQDLVLKLYSSNTTPAETDTAVTYTEATFSGYSAIPLTGATWGSPSAGSITYSSQQTFTHNGGGVSNSIYGYFVVQSVSGTLLYAERDGSAPFTLTNNGDNVKITPTLSAD
jgi:hypothetical protein